MTLNRDVSHQSEARIMSFSQVSSDQQPNSWNTELTNLKDGREDIVKADWTLEQGGQLGVLWRIAALGSRPKPRHSREGGGGEGSHPVLRSAWASGDLGEAAWTRGQPARRLARPSRVTRHWGCDVRSGQERDYCSYTLLSLSEIFWNNQSQHSCSLST